MTISTQAQSSTLYHYTDATGLIGILTKQELWATDALFLNDAQELRYRRLELADRLEAEGRRMSSLDNKQKIGAKAVAFLAQALRNDSLPETTRNDFLHRVTMHPHGNVYMTCFCQDSDLLSQWRGYAKGSGYAIGFHFDEPIRPNWEPLTSYVGVSMLPPVRLIQVAYGPEALDSLVQRIMSKIDGVLDQFDTVLLYTLSELAGAKHEGFLEEQEWRLVVSGIVPSALRRFRTGPLGVTPYCVIPFDISAVIEIIVGPGAEQELHIRAAQQLLNDVGSSALVRASSVPYRN